MQFKLPQQCGMRITETGLRRMAVKVALRVTGQISAAVEWLPWPARHLKGYRFLRRAIEEGVGIRTITDSGQHKILHRSEVRQGRRTISSLGNFRDFDVGSCCIWWHLPFLQELVATRCAPKIVGKTTTGPTSIG